MEEDKRDDDRKQSEPPLCVIVHDQLLAEFKEAKQNTLQGQTALDEAFNALRTLSLRDDEGPCFHVIRARRAALKSLLGEEHQCKRRVEQQFEVVVKEANLPNRNKYFH